MGWSGGTEVMEALIMVIVLHVDNDDSRRAIYLKLIDKLRDLDWDCCEECLGIDDAYDIAYYETFGHEEEE